MWNVLRLLKYILWERRMKISAFVCVYIQIYVYLFIYLFTSVWVWEGMSEITDFIELRVLVEAGGHSLSRNSGNKTFIFFTVFTGSRQWNLWWPRQIRSTLPSIRRCHLWSLTPCVPHKPLPSLVILTIFGDITNYGVLNLFYSSQLLPSVSYT